MSYLSGLISGFSDSARLGREESARNAEREYARESRVMEHLATADDPEVANAAASALLDMAVGAKRPKGGFLSRLLGDPTATVNPAVASVMQLIKTPVSGGPGIKATVGATPTFDPQNDGGAGAVPQGASAAMPPHAAGQPGGGPASPSALGVPGGATPSTPPVPAPLPLPVATGVPKFGGGTEVTTAGPPPRPRQLFLPPDEKMRRNTLARETAEVEGEAAGLVAAGMSQAEALEVVKQSRIHRATGSGAPFQAIAGEFVGPDGKTTVPGFASFNKTTQQWTDQNGQPVTNFRPRSQGTSASSSLGTMAERAARELGFPSAAAAGQAGKMAEVNARAAQLIQTEAGARATGTGDANADVPLTTQQRFAAITDLTNEYNKLTAPARVRREQLAIMETALERADADPGGAAESIRVTFEKILDTESVVREAEYARQTNGLSLGDKLRGIYQKYFVGGGDVPKEILAEFVNTARAFKERVETINAADIDRIRQRALAFNLDPALIGEGMTASAMTPPRVPPPPGSGRPNTVATPIAGGAGQTSTTLNAPPAKPSQPLLVDTTAHPWYAPDLDQYLRIASVPQGQPFAVVEYTDPQKVVHILHKYPDGTVRVVK